MRGCSWTGDRALLPALESMGRLDPEVTASGLGEAAWLCRGDGGEVETGDTEAAEIDAAYCELEQDIAGDALVDETDAKGDAERYSERGGGMLDDGTGEYVGRSVDPDGD